MRTVTKLAAWANRYQVQILPSQAETSRFHGRLFSVQAYHHGGTISTPSEYYFPNYRNNALDVFPLLGKVQAKLERRYCATADKLSAVENLAKFYSMPTSKLFYTRPLDGKSFLC